MKKILIVDGGPRRNMNTAALCDAFAEGARAASPEIEVGCNIYQRLKKS